MCEFCHKHGEGEKWYLQAQNYSNDLASDLRRRNFIADFFLHPHRLTDDIINLEKIQQKPSYIRAFIRAVLIPRYITRQKRLHYGQVVPIEDIETIFGFVNSIVRHPCTCRYLATGTEQRYCYGLSMVPPEESGFLNTIREIDVGYLSGPETKGFEVLSKDDAINSIRELEQKGLCHTVWTFITPFIGGICNCDRSDCIGMQATVTHGFPAMFRAEYVAEVDPNLCNGCHACMSVCQFGAISYSVAQEKAVIDPLKCYGCGICRASCVKNAIVLNERSAVPLVASLY